MTGKQRDQEKRCIKSPKKKTAGTGGGKGNRCSMATRTAAGHSKKGKRKKRGERTAAGGRRDIDRRNAVERAGRHREERRARERGATGRNDGRESGAPPGGTAGERAGCRREERRGRVGAREKRRQIRGSRRLASGVRASLLRYRRQRENVFRLPGTARAKRQKAWQEALRKRRGRRARGAG